MEIEAQADSVIGIEAVEIESYQISGSLNSIPGSISVLTRTDMRFSDVTNLSGVLLKLPGIYVHNGTYTTNRIVIRGMGSRTPYNTNRIRAYLNDIPLTTSDGLSSPEEMEPEVIGRAEIIRGPASALYGSGLGGNISLYTPADTARQLNFTLQYGSYDAWKAGASISEKYKRWHIYRNLSHFQTQGYRENSEYKRTSMLNSASWQKDRWKADLLLWISKVRGEIPSSLGITEFNNHPEHAAQNWKAIKGYKKYFRFLGGFSLSYSDQSFFTQKIIVFIRGIDQYEKRPFNNLDDQSLGAGLRSKSTWHWSKISMVAGAELLYDQYFWKFDTSKVVISKNRERRNQLNVFAIAYYRPGSGWTLSFASAINYLQYKRFDLFKGDGDYSGIKQFPVVYSPRFGVNYAVNSFLSVYFSAGHGFSQPSPEETVNPDGSINNRIKHEHGFQYETGFRLDIKNRVFAEGTFYWIELNDLLVTKRITEEIFTGINAGKTRHRGVEILLKGSVFKHPEFPGQLNASVSYTRSWNTFIDFTDDAQVYDGKKLPGIPEYTTYFELDWLPVRPVEWHVDMMQTGKQYINDSNSAKYEDELVINTKIYGTAIGKKTWTLQLFAGLNNIFNNAYASMLVVNARGFNGSEPRYYYPGQSRTFYAGMKLQF